MLDQKVIPTLDEIHSTFEDVRHKIRCANLCLDATIDDYPIGRRERGKCRLQVERAAGKGYRTARTTTNKFGRSCKPKKSTYTNNVIETASTGKAREKTPPNCPRAKPRPGFSASSSLPDEESFPSSLY